MVAILVLQPEETAGEPDPAPGTQVALGGRAAVSGPQPVDVARVEPLRPGSAAKALPDRPTRVRRRRLVALLLTLALIGAIATAGRALVGAASSLEPSSPQPVEVPFLSPGVGETYVVKPGDTLWSIASAIAPDSDPRPVVDALRAANGGPDIQVGQRLMIRTD